MESAILMRHLFAINYIQQNLSECSRHSANIVSTQRQSIYNLFPQGDVFICRYKPLVLFVNFTFPCSILLSTVPDDFILGHLFSNSPKHLHHSCLQKRSCSLFHWEIEQSEGNFQNLHHQVTRLLTGWAHWALPILTPSPDLSPEPTLICLEAYLQHSLGCQIRI